MLNQSVSFFKNDLFYILFIYTFGINFVCLLNFNILLNILLHRNNAIKTNVKIICTEQKRKKQGFHCHHHFSTVSGVTSCYRKNKKQSLI